MNRRFLKICSCILCLALLVNMLPMSIFAEEFQEALAASGSIAETKPEEATVVHEITENRTEYTKEFLLSNGLRMATVYATPVHYQEGGNWKEIDNTLTTKATGVLSNTAGIWDISFPQQMTKENCITIHKDGYTLSFGMAGELRNTGLELATAESNLSNAAIVEQAETFAVGAMQNTTAKIEQVDLSAMKESAQYQEIVPQKLQSRLKYENVFSDTDVTYDLDSNTVKESIILNTYSDTLRGYRYTLNVGKLHPVLEEDGQITFYDEKQENVVMIMPAPYLLDNAQEMSTDIQVQLTGNGSTYTLTYILPRQWLAAKERQWPVILDPVVQGDTTRSNIRDVTVCEGKVYDNNWGMLMCGHSSTYGISRFYVKYDDLPVITSSDVVISAAMSICKYTDGSDMLVEAHKVTSTWDSVGMTWANKPGFNSNIDDYVIVNSAGYYNWDITDIVRQWYAEANTGVMFKLSNTSESASVNNYRQFYSSDYGSNRPILTICFRNNNGLESYWDYLSASAGRSGTGYVNKYTGNLTWTRELIGFGGNRMPVSIAQTYNANDAIYLTDENNANDTAGHKFGMGKGWRTNYHQRIYKWSVDGNYYVWEDSDGTDHYFKYSSANTYKDEDGLELTLTTNGSGTKKYCLKDKTGNCSYFDTEGRLTQITDNQATKSSINITYKNATSWLIAQITDGVGRKYKFNYTNDYLANIVYTGTDDAEDARVSFVYTGTDQIYTLDNDSKKTIYTYDTKGLLTSVQDIDGYKIAYTYNTVRDLWQPYRVTGITETDDNIQGSALTLEYAHNQTTVTDHQGNKEIYQFNNFGNVISVQDDEGHATYSQYARNTDNASGKKNQLTLSSTLQNTVGNKFRDSSFENGDYFVAIDSSVTSGRSSETTYRGNYATKMTRTVAGEESGVAGGTITVPVGQTYTFSAHVKTGAGSVYIVANDGTSIIRGDSLPANSGWTRLQVTYTNHSTSTKSVSTQILTKDVGVTYIDCVQGERAETASRYNLVTNGDFSASASLYGWSNPSPSSTDGEVTVADSVAPQLENSVLKITGNPTGYKQLVQYINVRGSTGDSYVISGWAKGNSVPVGNFYNNEREFEVEVALHNSDGTLTYGTAKFNPDSDQWQYSAAAAVANKAYHSMSVIIRYNFNANTVYFDGIQLFKEEFGTSYTYDDKGNVVSTTDLQKQTTTYEYDTSNNLTKVIQNNKAKLTYTYDSYHNVKTAKTEEGLEYAFTYDTYGNNTKVTVGSGTSKISSSATYTANGNYLASATDALDKVTAYSYNESTGVLDWVQYPEDTAETRTEYTYDNMFRTAMVDCTTDTGANMSASYTYTDDYLTKIQTPTTAYNLTYGDFGLRTSVKAGDCTLASYEYTNDRNRYLDTLAYGNGDSIHYDYDSKGRVVKETYEDGATVQYFYNNDGNLAKVMDSATGITTTYYYDLTDRMMKYVESGTSYTLSVGYEYDTKNNLTQLVETTNGATVTTSYTYDNDNRIKTVTTGNTTVTYTYDGYGRTSQKVTKVGSTVHKTEEYTYTGTSTGTSAQVATHKTICGGVTTTYAYTYDDNGNILTVSDGTNTTSYVYDSANQLIRENNQAGGFTHTWEYDNAGNILSRKEYAYTTGELGTLTDTDAYTYEDMDWGDLLTAYDGNAITHDGIGNPLSDGTWTYTWKHGRQMASMSDGSTTWSYTYDADGLRTKRTNGTDTYSYVYNGGSLSKLTKGSDTLCFTYDANGAPLTVNYNGTVYYYKTNLQGDVTAIVDGNGNTVADYRYNAWGNPIPETDETPTALETLNPLRYRGYVYDTETGLYYLQSRYYNPEMVRFVNADGQLITNNLVGFDLFTYCFNNPVNFKDQDGRNPALLKSWTSSMWWLCGVDTTLPIGDLVYALGIIVLGIGSLFLTQDSGPETTVDEDVETYNPPMPNNNNKKDDDDDDDYLDDDYYNDDSNFGGRKKIGKSKGKTPGNNQRQNKQFKDAIKGKLDKIQQRMLHERITKQGLGFHEIVDEVKDLMFIDLFLDD